jgi:hypothetical protein
MVTLQTITTIELSSICNLECLYCINRKLVRSPVRHAGLMTDDVFEKTCAVLKKLVDRGTQREVNLNGNGESLLDYQLIDRIKIIRDLVGPDRHVGLSTNGLLITEKMAADLRDSGLTRLDISPHSPYHARRAAHIMYESGMKKGMVSMGCMVMSHNWAGQLEKEHQINCKLTNKCDPLIEGRGYVLSEGNVTVCCYDYENLGVYGSVWDDRLLDRPIKPFLLCHTCHQVIPPFIEKEYNFTQRPPKIEVVS